MRVFERLLAVAIGIGVLTLPAACERGGGRAEPLDAVRARAIEDSVTRFAGEVTGVLRREGPAGWLRLFDLREGFHMASDGALVFPSVAAAEARVAELERRYVTIDLQWPDLRVEPLGPGVASIAAAFRETLADSAGAETSFGGYVTGVATHRPEGWRFSSLHWSSPPP